MQIELIQHIEFGNQRLYPVNNTAFLFCKLTGRKTFLDSDVQIAKELGYTVTIH